ncbi:ATP-dependent helicase [Patescibacteria group bacterium]|nr:ATP-dependent helicase [Patescibacteria group bacterium]
MTLIHDSAFLAAYNKLNKRQRQAVDAVEGPVMVIAGPGTGKTQILTLRIANILRQTDAAPSSILALTFTETGAKAMRDRLRTYIGTAAYQVPIYTFHGFAAKLISDYPDAYVRVIGGRPINDLEKITLIETVLESGEVKSLRPLGNPTYYVTHILRIIGQLKQEYVRPDGLLTIIERQEAELLEMEKVHQKGAHKGKVRGEYTKKEQVITKNRELLFVYRRYEALLSEQRLFDFEDMIIETVEALLTNESMLRDLQETYQYLLADEHQDVNGAQNKILELLASFHEQPNIFAVGDEKQAIYRFQGATLENFLHFTERFPGTQVITLTENYRSGQTILDAAHSLVRVEEGPLVDLRVPLTAGAVSDSEVTRRDFSHQAVEDSWLVEAIVADSARGVPLAEIAVIVRTNREVEALSALLRKSGLTVAASADGDILRHPITQAISQLMQAVITDKSEAALFVVLHGAYWGITTNDLLKVLSAQSYSRSLWQIMSDELSLQELGVSNSAAFSRVVWVLEEARKREVPEAPHRVLEFILKESGFLEHVLRYDPFEGTRVVRRLYDEVEAMVSRDGVGSLREVHAALTARVAYNLPLTAPYIVTDTSAVQVMTAHKSKGLEFAHVYVPHLTSGGWSGATKKKYFDIPLAAHATGIEHEFFEDERRLLYVAMTRAKTHLSLSWAGMSSEGREQEMAELVTALDENTVGLKDTHDAEARFNPLTQLVQVLRRPAVDRQLLSKLLSERGFSATSLNNYIRSPWDYFYRNVLRIPETQALPMQFGTAMHSVLEYMTRHHTSTGVFPSDSVLKKKLENALDRLPVNTAEYVRLLEKGLESLMAYTQHLATELPKVTREELKLRVHLATGIPEFPELVLTGNIDRVDMGEDGRAYRVVDYKTGKPKSRNVIEGNTKDADGAYKRQLTFYALLLSLYDDERYQCREGVLSFVEPDSKGVIKEEAFTITEEEIEELKKTIIDATKEIITGDFLQSPIDGGESEYADLATIWQTPQED